MSDNNYGVILKPNQVARLSSYGLTPRQVGHHNQPFWIL